MRQIHISSVDKTVDSFDAEPFSQVSSNEWYGFDAEDVETRGVRSAAKEAFLKDESLEAPDMTYPRLDTLDYPRLERTYQALLSDAQEIAEPELSDQAYEKSARKLAEMFRHKEISRRLGWTANKTLSRERAGLMTLELFGEPDKNDFAHLVGALRQKAADIEGSSIAQELLELTGEVTSETPEPSYELHDNTLEVLRSDLFEILPGLREIIAVIPEQESSLEDKHSFMQRVAETVTGESRQLVNVTPGARAAETSAQDVNITIGSERLNKLGSEQLVKTTVHESIGHLLRIINASKQRDEHLRHTQPGNLKFEEGFATALEQIITGEKRIAGQQYYLSLGLQLGLDRNGEVRNFRETFEILWRRLVVEDLAAGKQPNEDEAREKAYLQCVRTTRGGALDARDISYMEGSKLLYPWLNELALLPEEDRINTLRTVLSGRFDATDQQQMCRYQAEA